MCRVECALTAVLAGCLFICAGQPVGSPVSLGEEDARREAAIAEFTRKMKEANYPALFDKAAQEFNVPADVLKGIAFAETRWEQLTWPPGETASPDTGMPRPYGIMSLWDNPFFGHSLLEAAQLIGEQPETLKTDAFQNIRGAAALLRKLYDETPKPAGTTEADVESWRYAIRKYCGIPEPELNARHALDIYTFMSQGYHQYGIEWNGHPVNLEPIRQETMKIVAEAEAKHQPFDPLSGTNGLTSHAADMGAAQSQTGAFVSNSTSSSPTNLEAGNTSLRNGPKKAVWWLIGGAPLLVALALLLALKKGNRRS